MVTRCTRALSRKSCTRRTTFKRVVRWVSTQSVLTGVSVILLDFEIVMHRLNVFCVTSNGRGLVCRFLGPGAAGQPYDSILICIDMNTSHAGYVLSSELRLDCRCDGRILHEGHRM